MLEEQPQPARNRPRRRARKADPDPVPDSYDEEELRPALEPTVAEIEAALVELEKAGLARLLTRGLRRA